MKWRKTTKPLEDGWYWRKCKDDDPEPDIIEVVNGVIVDTQTMDGFGANWKVYEHDEFEGWLWFGPLEVPSPKEHKSR